MLSAVHFFDLSRSKYKDLFDDTEYTWDALKKLPQYVISNLKPGIFGKVSPLAFVEGDVYIGFGTIVEPYSVIKGPVIIGDNCQIRAGAYIRDYVIVGDNSVVGHTTELKCCLLFNEVSVPHFCYVGDSILGWKSHLGAGVKISNVKINNEHVIVNVHGTRYETDLHKFGAILGDEVEIGCNSVLNPGTLIGKRTLVYANASLRGFYPSDSIIKIRQQYEIVERKKL